MIRFANKTLPSYIKVTGINYSILPSIESKTEKVYGRAGSYDFGIELGERKIEVEIMIIANDQNDVMKKAREFSTYLYYKDLQPLILLDEPDKQYMARLTGDTELTELFRTGTATLNFLCPSPYAESLVERTVNYTPVDYTEAQVTNNGSAETYPVIDMTLKEDATSISMITADKFVKIGADESISKTPVDIQPRVIYETMDSYTGWTTASQVDGGVVTGSLSSNGWAIQQSSKDYGSGTGWHGGAGIKTLSRQLQDFQVTGRVTLDSSKADQLGRIEIYLLDINNVIIGKVAIVDSDPNMDKPRVEARAGALSGGKYFVNSYGDKKGVFADYEGLLQIERVGKQWKAYFCKIDSNGRHHTRLAETWYDSSNNYSSKKLAKVQVHIGTYGEGQPVSSMLFSHLNVDEMNIQVDYNTQIPLTFKAGDVVTIDNQKAIVLKNGQPVFTELDPSSDFFALERGVNGIMLSPPIADVKIRFKERWL